MSHSPLTKKQVKSLEKLGIYVDEVVSEDESLKFKVHTRISSEVLVPHELLGKINLLEEVTAKMIEITNDLQECNVLGRALRDLILVPHLRQVLSQVDPPKEEIKVDE